MPSVFGSVISTCTLSPVMTLYGTWTLMVVTFTPSIDIASSLSIVPSLLASSSINSTFRSLVSIVSSVALAVFVTPFIVASTCAGSFLSIWTSGIVSLLSAGSKSVWLSGNFRVMRLPTFETTVYSCSTPPFTLTFITSPLFTVVGIWSVAEVVFNWPSVIASSLLSTSFLSLSSLINSLKPVPAPAPWASSIMSLFVSTLSTPVSSVTLAFMIVVWSSVKFRVYLTTLFPFKSSVMLNVSPPPMATKFPLASLLMVYSLVVLLFEVPSLYDSTTSLSPTTKFEGSFIVAVVVVSLWSLLASALYKMPSLSASSSKVIFISSWSFSRMLWFCASAFLPPLASVVSVVTLIVLPASIKTPLISISFVSLAVIEVWVEVSSSMILPLGSLPVTL